MTDRQRHTLREQRESPRVRFTLWDTKSSWVLVRFNRTQGRSTNNSWYQVCTRWIVRCRILLVPTICLKWDNFCRKSQTLSRNHKDRVIGIPTQSWIRGWPVIKCVHPDGKNVFIEKREEEQISETSVFFSPVLSINWKFSVKQLEIILFSLLRLK